MTRLLARPVHSSRARRRKGTIIVLTALLMILLLAMVAFALDLGMLNVTRTELQRAADSAALAAACELVDESGFTQATSWSVLDDNARSRAAQYASLNQVLANNAGLAMSDVAIGHMSDPSDPTCVMTSYGASAPNAARVRVQRTASQNGQVPLFFGRALGVHQLSMQAQATAALLNSIAGLKAPSDGGNLYLLPFALDLETWDDLLAGGGSDAWNYDSISKEVRSGSDGVREINLFPLDTGSSGNRGTVDIGGCNNSTSDLARQIADGVSPADLAHHGGELAFNSSGQLYLGGDPGISAGMQGALQSIIGQPRMIPIFSSVSGNGNNGTYTIVKFVGIRVLSVNLSGGDKHLIIQPANVVTRGAIPGTSNTTSQFIYSPVTLVR